MFVCTSNTMNIPGPLLDRMEVIRIPGYTEDEKLNIAGRYLIPKQIKLNGLKKEEVTIGEDAVIDIIRYYTREAGVRSLEREIAKVCRKMVKAFALATHESPATVTADMLADLLGVRKFNYGIAEEENKIGQVTGLAWTSVGGELLTIEAVAVAGKGRHVKTGSLGDVMQESIQAANTVVRSRSQVLGIPANYHEKHDLHIHVPEGATPKDGPSAGIAMCTALVSVLTEIPVRADVAMTGEITLRGEVLPIRRTQGKTAGRTQGWYQDCHHSQGKRARSQRGARQHQGTPRNIACEMDRRGVGAGAGNHAGTAYGRRVFRGFGGCELRRGHR